MNQNNPILSLKSLRDTRNTKTGAIIPAGSTFSARFLERGEMEISHPAFSAPIKTKMFRFFFKEPSLRTLEKWSSDGIAKSVTGHRVEPDGYGPDGSPSWLLALGLI